MSVATPLGVSGDPRERGPGVTTLAVTPRKRGTGVTTLAVTPRKRGTGVTTLAVTPRKHGTDVTTLEGSAKVRDLRASAMALRGNGDPRKSEHSDVAALLETRDLLTHEIGAQA